MFGNIGGSSIVVSKLRKRAALAARFMLQMMQTPLFSKDNEEHSEDCFSCGEEGLAVRIAVEVSFNGYVYFFGKFCTCRHHVRC